MKKGRTEKMKMRTEWKKRNSVYDFSGLDTNQKDVFFSILKLNSWMMVFILFVGSEYAI